MVLCIIYISLLLWNLSSLYVVVHLQSFLINMYLCCIQKDIFVFCNFFNIVLIITFSKRKSNNLDVFYKIGVLKNFTKYTGKCLYQSLFLEACNFIKTRLRCRCFLYFCKVFRNIYFVEHLRTAASEKRKHQQ